MTTATSTAEPAMIDHDRHVRRHLVRNYLAHSLEGGVFIGGLMFLSSAVVLPKMVQSLGGPDWLIATTPLVLMLGYQLPGLLTVHLIERLKRLRPILLILGVFQRLPYLLAGLLLMRSGDGWPALVLAAVILCPFLSGFVGGIGSAAWLELVANTIPPNRRSSLWAVRNIISSLIGITAGFVVLKVLAARPGAAGYGVLHLITFALMVVSYVLFWLIRETPNPRPLPGRAVGLVNSLAQMPSLIAAHPQLRRYILASVFGAGIAIMVPRLTIHTLAVLGRPESYAGALLSVMTFGGLAGNFLAGLLGDYRGGKAVVVAGLIGMLATCGWAMTAASAWEFWCIFFLLGGAGSAYHVGNGTLNLEVVPLDQRVRCLAIIGAASLASMIAIVLTGWGAWRISNGSFACVACLAAASLVASLVFVLRVKEPRAASPTRSMNR